MKKTYIAPSIKVRTIAERENILAASGEGQSKWNIGWSDDESQQITDPSEVGAKRHFINWDDQEE